MVNLNTKEHERAICYLTFKDRKICPTCELSLDELILNDKDNRRKKHGKICECGWFHEGKPKDEPRLCPKCKGHRRLRPLLIVEHELGKGKDEEMRWGCYSCNRLMTHVDQEIHSEERPLTREKMDYLIGKPALVNFVGDRIIANKDDHVCQGTILNAPFGERSYSLVTKRRWFNEYVWTTENERRGKFDLFDFTCNSPLCNGQHVAFHGLIPQDIVETLRLQEEIDQTKNYYKKF